MKNDPTFARDSNIQSAASSKLETIKSPLLCDTTENQYFACSYKISREGKTNEINILFNFLYFQIARKTVFSGYPAFAREKTTANHVLSFENIYIILMSHGEAGAVSSLINQDQVSFC